MDPMSLMSALAAAFALGLFIAVLVAESRRKGAVQSLRESEERLKKLFRNSPAAIGLVRLGDGVMLDINESYERLFGWRREEVIGASVEALRVWADPEQRARFRARLAAEGRVVGFVSSARRKDGELFESLLSSEIIEEGGERIAIVIVVDVTERKRAEDALRASEERFAKMFREAPESMTLVRAADGTYLDVNREFERQTGFARPQALGRTSIDLGLWQRPAEREEMLRQLREKGGVGGLEFDMRCRDGTVRHTLLHGATVEITGEPCWLFVLRDITERKRAEEDLRELKEELEHKVAARTGALDAANRELEAFSYSVSHDLRAPLRAIEGFSRLLEERHAAALAGEARGYVQRVRTAARRMNLLINDLLAFSRVGRVEMRRRDVDLSALAAAVAREIASGAAERRVEWRIEEGLSAYADEGLMRVVLENLLGNAWKYTGRTPQAVIEFGRSGTQEFRVRDNGVGFDPEHRDALFQPFRRLHGEQEFEGSGVGLATVKRIIERHGGSVRGEGAVGAGAAFYFALPGASAR